ncbi:MAG: hypothetical protein QM496_18640 [Verrucomicrobiota bacterium]
MHHTLKSSSFISNLFVLVSAFTLLSCERRATPTLPQSQTTLPGAASGSPIEAIITTALNDPESLQNISFADVIHASSGKEVIAMDLNQNEDAELIEALSDAITRVMERFNRPDSPTSAEKRINEVSKHFEKALQIEINSTDGFLCAAPRTATGKTQRSGYPDLRIVHQETGRVSYLDPKLIAAGSIHSSLRTFYFTPKKESGKILDDAHHLLIGIEHDSHNGAWKFTKWRLVDLSGLKIRLKPEFQASNKDIYLKERILIENQPEIAAKSK